MNKTEDLSIALITGLLLVATSFIPLVQILLFQLNGLLFYPVTVWLPEKGIYVIMMINGVISVLSLLLFYRAKTKRLRIIGALVLTVFLLPLFIFLSENIVSEDPYFLQLLLGGFIIGLLLAILALLKDLSGTSSKSDSSV